MGTKQGKIKASTNERKSKDPLTEIFHSNFQLALEQSPEGALTVAKLARKIGTSKSVVGKWATGQGIASAHQLLKLSRALDREVGWFLESHNFAQEPSVLKPVTYVDAFHLIRQLIELHAIDKNAIDDYFLRYMVKRYYEIALLKNVPEKEKDVWFRNLIMEYDIPVMAQVDQKMYEFFEEEYRQMDDDSTHLKVLHLVRDYLSAGKDKNLLAAEYEKWLGKKHPTELEFQRIHEAILEDPTILNDDDDD